MLSTEAVGVWRLNVNRPIDISAEANVSPIGAIPRKNEPNRVLVVVCCSLPFLMLGLCCEKPDGESFVCMLIVPRLVDQPFVHAQVYIGTMHPLTFISVWGLHRYIFTSKLLRYRSPAMSCLDVMYHQTYGAHQYLPATSAAYKAAYYRRQQKQLKQQVGLWLIGDRDTPQYI